MQATSQIILAIESSCDETAAAIVQDGVVISNIIATQKVHEQYGGVVPELASRAHIQNIVPVVNKAIGDAGLQKSDITAISFTQSPGLIGSLIVGACFAKGFAQARNIPLIAVQHMQAHVLAHWIETPKPKFPFLCLTVSGGHTQLVLLQDHLNMKVIGSTLDDAAGEAFDKVAKMLDLPYPGGPMIDQWAQDGNPHRFSFPIPDMKELNFSFSGVKTAVLYFIKKQTQENPDFIRENLRDICASVQHTIVSALLHKLKQAADQYQVTEIGIAGGVSANKGLRAALTELGKQQSWNIYLPKFEYCTDNAAMIGITAYYKIQKGGFADLSVAPSARSVTHE